jgi:hypothetical protein
MSTLPDLRQVRSLNRHAQSERFFEPQDAVQVLLEGVWHDERLLASVRFGAVVDFLDFHLAGYHWPAFNVADAGICVGAALMVADGLLTRQSQPT